MEFTQIVQSDLNGSKLSKRRSRTSESQRQYYVQLWQESNLSQKVFCQQHNIHLKTFSNWIKKIKSSPKQTTRNNLLPKEAAFNTDKNLKLEFQFPNEICVSITGSPDAEMLLSIIKGVSTCKFN
jgi:hypothetical protein